MMIEAPIELGHFCIEAEIGRGGMGVVYRATDRKLDRPVAIKVPLRERIGGPADIERYIAEARTDAGAGGTGGYAGERGVDNTV